MGKTRSIQIPMQNKCATALAKNTQFIFPPGQRYKVKENGVTKKQRLTNKTVLTAIRALQNPKGSTIKEINDFLVTEGHTITNSAIKMMVMSMIKLNIVGNVRGSKHRFVEVIKSQKPKHSKSINTSSDDKLYEHCENINTNKCNDTNKDPKSKLHTWLKDTVNKFNPRSLVTSISSRSPVSNVRVGNRSISALLDTGATLSIISPDAYDTIAGSCPLVTPEEAPILYTIQPQAANGTAIGFRGITVADVTVNGTKVPGAFILVGKSPRPPPPLIIGMNVIKYLKNFVPAKHGKRDKDSKSSCAKKRKRR